MYKLGYYLAKIASNIKHTQEPIINYYRKQGVKIGEGCLICSPSVLTKEPELIEIGNNVTISTNVSFVTHDNSAKLIFPGEGGNLFGKIIIGNNSFIGQNATLLYGVELAQNTIVASGAVVTKSFYESNIIIGGNPARIISTWDKYRIKAEGYNTHRRDLYTNLRNNSSFLIKR